MKRLVFLFVLVMLISGCATTKMDYQRSNLTFGMVKKSLVKNQTTQAEILNLFGAPNITTRNKSGEEVWTYDKIAVSSEEASGGVGIGAGGPAGGAVIGGVAGGGKSSSSTSSKSITLIITFLSDKDVVKDYAVMAQAF